MSEKAGNVSAVAERYASALFELASQAGAVDAVGQELDRFLGLVSESADLARLVKSPVFGVDDQVKALTAVLSRAGLSGIAANFILLAARNRRLSAVDGMISGYKALVAASRGEIAAEVVSAEPLSEKQLADLVASLSEVTAKSVKVSAKVDTSLIGGLIVKVGSRMVDTSLKTKLNSLKFALKEVR